MPQIVAWKCPQTGKVFEIKSAYKAHLAQLAKERRKQRNIEAENAKIRSIWQEIQEIEMSIDQFSKFIFANQTLFWEEAKRSDWTSWRWKGRNTFPTLIEFTEFKLFWNEHVSNTHSCPHNGVMNFRGLDGIPKGYPGWKGRIGWKVNDIESPVGSSLFSGKNCRIHTGSGGGGSNYFTYEVIIYAADWPGLARYRKKQEIWKILKQK